MAPNDPVIGTATLMLLVAPSVKFVPSILIENFMTRLLVDAAVLIAETVMRSLAAVPFFGNRKGTAEITLFVEFATMFVTVVWKLSRA